MSVNRPGNVCVGVRATPEYTLSSRRPHPPWKHGDRRSVGLPDRQSGGDDDATAPVTERAVGDAGSISQYQVDAGSGGRLDTSVPSSPSVAWRRTPAHRDGSQPVVDGTDVYLAFDGTPVNLALGDVEVARTANIGHASKSAPAVHGGVVYVTVWNGGESVPRGLAAVDPTDGTVRWRVLTDNDIGAAPTPADDVYALNDG